MKTVVRKLKNISNTQIPVKIDNFTTVYLGKGEVIENKEIYNLESLNGLVEVEQDLSEVNPINEGLQYLKD